MDISTSLPFNIIYSLFLIIVLVTDVFHIYPIPINIFVLFSIIGVIPVIINGIKALIKGKFTIDLLASIALLFSFIAKEWHSAIFINLMLSFARILDMWTESRTKRIINQLLKYRPATVKIKRGDEIVEIATDTVTVGELVVIEAGERIPVDGVVESGSASINESTLTGESELVSKKAGSLVYSSTYNELGSLVVKATKVGEDSTLSRIIALIEEASRSKAKTERIADVFTQWYIIIMLCSSVFLYIVTHNAAAVLSILLVVCADDIAVCVPLSFTIAIALGAKRGIIIKGSDVIEKLSRIRAFITDKTGTLTNGKPKILEVKIIGDHTEAEVLEDLGISAINSSHPVDTAIIKYLKEKEVKILAPDECTESPGDGLVVRKGQNTIHIGKIEYLVQNKVPVSSEEQAVIDSYKNDGFSLSALAINQQLSALVIFEDEIKSVAPSVIAQTKKLGAVSWTMITGDNEKVASHVAKVVGIDHVHCNVSPEQKLLYTKEIKKETNGIVAMIGDGVNDAASLALADVSIAMGAIGSDAAIEAADIALMNDKLERIPEAMLIGKKTMQIVKQNFIIWAITNGFGLFLVLIGVMTPSGAATYNFVTDFFPIANTLWLGLYKPYKTRL
jgi:Zn2+/Cd2+-exporting ATPase